MKTVIQVWTHTCVNTPGSFWGLGDILRGTLQVYQLCKKYNYNFIVDIQLHNLSNHLVNHSHEYMQIIQDNKDNIEFIHPPVLEDFILNNKNKLIYFFTNGLPSFCDENLDNDSKNFIKNVLTPNDTLNKYISTTLKKIPDNYNILHYRLGDEELVKKNTFTYISYIDQLIKNVEDNDLLLSDSKIFKCMVKTLNHKNLIMFETEPKHIGYESSESLHDTLFEFFLITKSKNIKTFSRYGWISGFVFWAHKIYNIPLKQI